MTGKTLSSGLPWARRIDAAARAVAIQSRVGGPVEKLPELDRAQEFLQTAARWVVAHIFVLSTLTQVLLVVFAFLVAKLAEPRITGRFEKRGRDARFEKYVAPVVRTLMPLTLPLVWLVLLWIGVSVASQAGWPHHLMRGAVSLITAWVIIRLAATLVRNPTWSRIIAVSAWTVAALNIVGILDETLEVMDRMAIQLGDLRISVLGVGKAVLALLVLLWLAGIVSRLLERRINAMDNLTPSARVLFGKLLRIGLYTLAVVVALDSVGIDLTAFAVFSGAVGLGVGFGLQKVISNLISGVILLLDKSVKPGDVIAVGETYGWINTLGARYVSVITRDGTEHLIPNEELISQRVENWSYSHRRVRLRIPIGIAYSSDVPKAIALAKEAGVAVERVLADPAPACLLTGFGDSAVDLELRLWIQDPQEGVSNVKSQVLLKVWETFHDNGIEFPFPQRDLHLRSTVPLEVTLAEKP